MTGTASDHRVFSPGYVATAARILGLLSHETRLGLVLLLAQGESNVGDLCRRLELAQSNVSNHLRILRDSGLVVDRRDGQFVIYQLNIPVWRAVADGFFEHLLDGANAVTLQHVRVERLGAER